MKIAIATDGNRVSEHFGHCESFTIVAAEEGKPTGWETTPNPGHKPGFLPNFLQDRGVSVVVAGGMGEGARDLFQQKHIDVITGASGPVDEVAQLYFSGRLVSTDSVCKEHQHAGECDCGKQ